MQIQGITNHGNQCYQNSVLQLLASLPELRKFVAENGAEDRPLTKALQCFYSHHQVDGLRMFHNVEQHDAHEYLTLLLDRLNDETKNRLCPLLFSHQVMTRMINQEDSADVATILANETILVVPFSSSLLESLRLVQEAEVLPDWYSERHSKKCRFTKTCTISQWPLYLFILVQRGMSLGSKIHHAMDIPDTLYEYHLAGGIIHFGSPSYGHYVAVLRRGKEWFLCDDRNVRSLQEPDKTQFLSQAYMLLYSQEKDGNSGEG